MTASADGDVPATTSPPPSLTVLLEWGQIGCIGFGGPPTHIRLVDAATVETFGSPTWITIESLTYAISLRGVHGKSPDRNQSVNDGGRKITGAMAARVATYAWITCQDRLAARLTDASYTLRR